MTSDEKGSLVVLFIVLFIIVFGTILVAAHEDQAINNRIDGFEAKICQLHDEEIDRLRCELELEK